MISAVNFNPYYLQTKSARAQRQADYANLDAPKNVSFGNNMQVIFKKGKSFGEMISALRLLMKDWEVAEYGLLKEGNSPIVSKEILGEIPLEKRKSKKCTFGTVERQIFANEHLKYSILKNRQHIAEIHVLNTTNQIYIPYFTNTLGRNRYRGLEKSLLQIVAEDFTNKGSLKDISGDASEIGLDKHSRAAIYKRLGAQIEDVSCSAFVKNATLPQADIINRLIKLSDKNKLFFPQTKANLEKLCYNKNA